jgi:hypothetical protein
LRASSISPSFRAILRTSHRAQTTIATLACSHHRTVSPTHRYGALLHSGSPPCRNECPVRPAQNRPTMANSRCRAPRHPSQEIGCPSIALSHRAPHQRIRPSRDRRSMLAVWAYRNRLAEALVTPNRIHSPTHTLHRPLPVFTAILPWRRPGRRCLAFLKLRPLRRRNTSPGRSR